jgi:hypothetical protein
VSAFLYGDETMKLARDVLFNAQKFKSLNARLQAVKISPSVAWGKDSVAREEQSRTRKFPSDFSL